MQALYHGVVSWKVLYPGDGNIRTASELDIVRTRCLRRCCLGRLDNIKSRLSSLLPVFVVDSFQEVLVLLVPTPVTMASITPSPPSEVVDYDKKDTSQYLEKVASPGSEQTIWDVLPKDQPAWWKQKHLLLLNLGMIIPYLSSTTNGYDGSMLNGLQSMVCIV